MIVGQACRASRAAGQLLSGFAVAGHASGEDAAGKNLFAQLRRDLRILLQEGASFFLALAQVSFAVLEPGTAARGSDQRLHRLDDVAAAYGVLGITLALIPTDTPGVNIGRRHFPLNGAFMNGPNWGKDVFVPLDYVIGGVEYVGQGWKMLMNCLAAGRSISLPSSNTGMAKLAVRGPDAGAVLTADAAGHRSAGHRHRDRH